jgi:prevent-host-death family protein
MRHFGTFEAKNKISALLDLVEAGEEVTITRNGRPVARLVPAEVRDVEKARAAAAGLRAIRAKSNPDPDGLTVRDYIEMGRRY